ncbi:MAG: hypothetical protein ACE5F9_14945 [Phycisphaerae bacterium]
MDWLQTGIVIIVVGGATAYLVRSLLRAAKGSCSGGGCTCGQVSDKPSSRRAPAGTRPDTLGRRLELVSLNIDRPKSSNG